jgi:hypothetical protein
MKASIIFTGIAGLGSVCLAVYRSIGATVDENGFLHEPFALLPIGFFLLAVGGIGLVISLVLRKNA